MFDGPQRAIRGAMSIRDAVQTLGIQVRAGLHTGECEVRGDDIGGIAVHIGARVSALARPQRRAGVQHAARPGDRVRTRVRRPRSSPAQGRARPMAPARGRLRVNPLTGRQNGGGSPSSCGGAGPVATRAARSWARVRRRLGIIAVRSTQCSAVAGAGDIAGGRTQRGEQQGAARGGDVGAPSRGGQDQGPVRQLLFAPAQEGFHQMMGSTF